MKMNFKKLFGNYNKTKDDIFILEFFNESCCFFSGKLNNKDLENYINITLIVTGNCKFTNETEYDVSPSDHFNSLCFNLIIVDSLKLFSSEFLEPILESLEKIAVFCSINEDGIYDCPNCLDVLNVYYNSAVVKISFKSFGVCQSELIDWSFPYILETINEQLQNSLDKLENLLEDYDSLSVIRDFDHKALKKNIIVRRRKRCLI